MKAPGRRKAVQLQPYATIAITIGDPTSHRLVFIRRQSAATCPPKYNIELGGARESVNQGSELHGLEVGVLVS